MSVIYGEKKKDRRKLLRYLAVILVVAALIAAGYYFLKPNPREVIKKNSQEILGYLDLLAIEYSEAVENGRVVQEEEYGASLEILEKAITSFEAMRQYAEEINPDAAERAGALIKELENKINDKASPDEVASLIDDLGKVITEISSSAQ